MPLNKIYNASIRFEAKEDGTVDVMMQFDKKEKFRFVANKTKAAISLSFKIDL